MSAIKQSAARDLKNNAVSYVPLVKRIAQRMAKRLPQHVEQDDLIGAGITGLLEAMERFEPGRNVSFTAYAEFRIKGAILDELRRRDLMARDARSEVKGLERTIEALQRELGRPPEEEEIAASLGVSLDALHERLGRLAPVQITDFNEHQHYDSHAGEVFDNVAKEELRQLLAEAITHLSERQQQVLYLYYQEDLTLKEVGAVLGVSESRVSQIMTTATLQLRTLMQSGAGGNHV